MHLRPAVVFALFNDEVLIGKGRYLRQMSNAENLLSPAKRFQLLAHRIRCATADADVDLIEDKRTRRRQLLSRLR